MNTYSLFLHPDCKSGYTVTVPELPGCVTDGDSLEEAVANAEEAIGLYLTEYQPRDAGSHRGVGGSGGDASIEVANGFGWTRLTQLPQHRRAAPPVVSPDLQASLPVLHDFRILLRPNDDRSMTPEFWSARCGFLAQCFAWRDELGSDFHAADEAMSDIGDVANPLIEVEQGQELFIWRQGGEVLVIAGDPEEEPGSFRLAVRVPEPVFAQALSSFRASWDGTPRSRSSLEACRGMSLTTVTRPTPPTTWLENPGTEFVAFQSPSV